MTLFSWKPAYSVNDAELDCHHKKLFAILNSVYESMMNSQMLDNMLPKIDELSEHTTLHFSAEERYMLENGYSGINAHIAEHREFTQTIETLRSRYHDNNLEVTRELIIVLGDWLLRHVLKEDKKYSKPSTEGTAERSQHDWEGVHP